MNRLFIIMLVTVFISSYQLKAQTIFPVDKWMEYVEEVAAESEDEAKSEALYAELSYLSEHPFELNSVTEEQLQKLPFLSDRQVQNLLAYRQRYGKMVTIYELKNVEELDFPTIALLLPFVYIGDISVDKRPITVKNLLKYGSNELQLRYDQCFRQKKGYRSQPDSVLQKYPNRRYLGEPFYNSVRYSYTFDERLQFGVVGEKDAGEPFWNSYHKGYDYYSAHLFIKDQKWLKSLAIGDYKVSFGQGLVISNDFSPSRNAIVAQAERRTNGFRRHYSTNENDFFRGAAATVVLGKIDVSFFYSYRKMDAGVDSNRICSFKTDGLHRVVGDLDKMGVVPMQTYGGNVRFASPNVCVGVTAISYSFGRFEVMPDPRPYNLYYFRGSNNTNISVDYLLKNRKLKFYGETAIASNGALATLNALQLTPASYISLLALHRYYDRRYQAFFGNAFAQSSTVQNEQGMYLGVQLTPLAHWKLSAYADFFRFPWLKYGVDAPSTGGEYMIQVDYNPKENLSFYLRYKQKQKENNKVEVVSDIAILPYRTHRLRLQAIYAPATCLAMRTSLDGVIYDEEVTPASKGFMIAQSAGWKPQSFPLQTDLYVAWFSTDDYSSRISSYEKNILYSFSMPTYYGKGVRLAATLRLDLWNCLSLSAKLAYTRYADREVIGTNLEEITGRDRTDLYALLRWKF